MVFNSENVAGAWLCGEFSFDLAVSFNFQEKVVLVCGRMAFGEKDNQRKMGRLVTSSMDSQSRGRKPSAEGAVFLNQHNRHDIS